MGGIIPGLFYFIRELIFDHKREYDFSSPDFDGRKMTYVILLFISLYVNYIFINRSWELAKETFIHAEEIEKLNKRIRYLEVEHEVDSLTIKTLQSIPEKNRRTTPSDEGRVRR